MRAAVFVLFLIVGPTVEVFLTLSGKPVYVPKSPRRPIILVWPSVMNPAVAEAIAKQVNETYRDGEYLKMECDKTTRYEIKEFILDEVLTELGAFEEQERAPTFWEHMVPPLIKWLSKTSIECGFYTIFRDVRHQIYRFLDSNRSKWVKALKELVYTLVQVIAVINHKTTTFAYGDKYAHLNWLEDWVESYEYWCKNYPTALEYLQKIVLNSFDIVTAWLYDYIAQHTKDSTWKLSNDPAIVCALENYDMVPALSWDHLLHYAEDKMKVMAATFVTCKVKGGCAYDETIEIFTGYKDRQSIVRIPDPSVCYLTCTPLPRVPNFQVPYYPATSYKLYAYAYAYMTTVVGHDLHCLIKSTHVRGNEVRTQCYPQVVEKFLTDRQYTICKSSGCTKPCCRPLRPPRQPHCEIVTHELSTTDWLFTNKTKILLTKSYPDHEKKNVMPLGE